jgi:2-amino-4-hydroxy-6-hydroxymethyldihydropteridine diphosphokinase
MHVIYLAIGVNVGDKQANIMQAVSLLSEKVRNIVLAPLYETKPWGYKHQENFINTVVKGETNLSLEKLLLLVKSIETKIGRIKRFRNGPREIDIDILLYDDVVYRSYTLTIPHPRMHERDFVLQPLVDIAPHIMHPVIHRSVYELMQEIPQEKRVVVKKILSEGFA